MKFKFSCGGDLVFAFLALLATRAGGQPIDMPVARGAGAATPLAWELTGRDFHSERWEAAVAMPALPGRRAPAQKHSFVTIATGLNYRDEQGNWQRTREEFALTPDGFAIARHGPHQLIVGNNANDWAVDFRTSDGVRLRSGPVAFGYFDPISGKSLTLGVIRDTEGVLTAPQEITFSHAFDGVDASVRISYRRAGMSSDLILHESPPAPGLFGLSAESRLEDSPACSRSATQ